VSLTQREERLSPSVRDEILTTEEVCALLKIKKVALYRHTSQGTGPPFYKIGKHNRWKRGEVLACSTRILDELIRSGRYSVAGDRVTSIQILNGASGGSR
jgi:excisionase family DNA binding protein